MIVLDASAAVDIFKPENDSGGWLQARVASEHTIHVPALFDLEVLQAFRGLEAGGILASNAIGTALGDLADLRAVRHGHEPFLGRIWSLRHNLTAYDAAYVALAEALDTPLITTDVALARTSVHEARIELPPELSP